MYAPYVMKYFKSTIYLISIFLTSKGQPSFVRLFKYPNFDGSNAVIAQKSFFKAERTDFYWNKTGNYYEQMILLLLLYT